jgi:peptide-methionine (S)-S-oxide reductase
MELREGIEVATFAGGCFGVLKQFFRTERVHKAVSGYIGGIVENPTYAAICKGDTGHAEAIRITFDSSIISFGTLLEFSLHDPTTLNRQGNDVGTQYSEILP